MNAARDYVTYAKLFDSALRSLTRRDHSVAELRTKLQRKFAAQGVRQVLVPDHIWSDKQTETPSQAYSLTSDLSNTHTSDSASLIGSKQPIEDVMDHLLGELEDQGLLDDARFAEAFVRSRANRGYGPIYIRQELRQKGLADRIGGPVLDEYAGQWSDVAKSQVGRRFSDAEQDQKIWLKAYRFLQRRGFTGDHIKSALGRMPSQHG